MGIQHFIKTCVGGATFAIALTLSVAAPAQGIFDTSYFDSDMIQAIRNHNDQELAAQLISGTPNERTSAGVPAIIVAVDSRNADAVNMLIEAGARVDVRDRDDNTALTVASHTGQAGIARALLDAGADVERTGAHGETALLKAARQGHADVARVLLEAGADPETSDLTGRTALEFAEAGRFRDVAEVLREFGATY